MWVRLASAVLVIQAIVTALAIPVVLIAYPTTKLNSNLIIAAAIILLLAPAVLRRPGGRMIGWLVQAFAVGASLSVPGLLLLTLVFVWLWWLALRYGDRIDADRATWVQEESE
jgi:hypothetical protein